MISVLVVRTSVLNAEDPHNSTDANQFSRYCGTENQFPFGAEVLSAMDIITVLNTRNRSTNCIIPRQLSYSSKSAGGALVQGAPEIPDRVLN
jgi:hypothetical protein